MSAVVVSHYPGSGWVWLSSELAKGSSSSTLYLGSNSGRLGQGAATNISFEVALRRETACRHSLCRRPPAVLVKIVGRKNVLALMKCYLRFVVGIAIGFFGTVALIIGVERVLVPKRPASLSRKTYAAANIDAAYEALQAYNKENGRYPSSQEGFQLLVPKYLDRVPSDSYGQALLYELEPEIASYGADGLSGGHLADADISLRCEIMRPRNNPRLPFHLAHLGATTWILTFVLGAAIVRRTLHPLALGALVGIIGIPILAAIVVSSGAFFLGRV